MGRVGGQDGRRGEAGEWIAGCIGATGLYKYIPSDVRLLGGVCVAEI